jgi:phospholipid transport system substrate-binding protein
MRKKGATWIVVDMETDGVSLVQTYRNDFNKNIKNDGWEALMKKMKDKLAEKE